MADSLLNTLNKACAIEFISVCIVVKLNEILIIKKQVVNEIIL